MKWFLLAFILLTVSYSLLFPNKVSPEKLEENFNAESQTNSMFVGGIQMNEGDQENWVNTLKNTGMNTVEVTVYAHQGRWNENNLWYYEDELAAIEEIRYAKSAGLRVVLILRLQLDHAFSENQFLWHGSVFPETDYLVQRWFEEYTRFTKKWAIISEREDVDVFVIGSELSALFATKPCNKIPILESYYLNKDKQQQYIERMMAFQNDLTEEHLYTPEVPNYTNLEAYLNDEIKCKEKWAKITTCSDSTNQLEAINVRRSVFNWYWERLIEEMRKVYNGKMTVAANFDNYQEIEFWDKLDFIGINAYFPLRDLNSNKEMTVQLKNSWDSILDEISKFKGENELDDQSILFTEIGYGNHTGSTFRPWQGSGFSVLETNRSDSLIIWKNQKPDQTERNIALNTLYTSIQEKNFPLAGLLYWKFTTKKEQLQYDPFALHIGKETDDELQEILLKFTKLNWLPDNERVKHMGRK